MIHLWPFEDRGAMTPKMSNPEHANGHGGEIGWRS